ncbi:hypothetical protein DC522_11735 [Microvirga sp. KLBC 81]|uniref:DUF6894 family protein n=1 Tax=Microvirga sp. KLBC 81 TaxID=1862707 RepID=UPI000D518ACA|nr:hypothetical protein [Microvirga sp. KLBC 81]PVE24155.1 hypothetical protein DC522_11735 [Microvirga sp. KLBC 81]
MPRFYFDVRDGAKFMPDDAGVELDSLEAAQRVAAEAAAEAAAKIGQDCLLQDDAQDVRVEVRNEHRQRVLTVTVSLEIHRVEPPPCA